MNKKEAMALRRIVELERSNLDAYGALGLVLYSQRRESR
jgi:hypothetical protein